ncbi:MAG TPA: hypothetical protein VGO93_13065 [Candidatus Xenobia bacterium]|jgi:hypothetical protein
MVKVLAWRPRLLASGRPALGDVSSVGKGITYRYEVDGRMFNVIT